MNAKTLRQIEEMKKQTIGVEVEMNNITRNKAAKIAAEFFGTGRYENTADRNGNGVPLTLTDACLRCTGTFCIMNLSIRKSGPQRK